MSKWKGLVSLSLEMFWSILGWYIFTFFNQLKNSSVYIYNDFWWYNSIPAFNWIIALSIIEKCWFQFLWPLWPHKSSGHFITLFKYLSLSVNNQSQTVMWDYPKQPKPQIELCRRTAAGFVWEKVSDPWLKTIIFCPKTIYISTDGI